MMRRSGRRYSSGEDFAYDFFRSVEDALWYLEPWFPAKYRTIEPSTQPPDGCAWLSTPRRRSKVGVARARSCASKVAESRPDRHTAGALLRAHLDRRPPPELHADMTFDDLLDAAMRRSGWTT
jgi:hypothetical protein